MVGAKTAYLRAGFTMLKPDSFYNRVDKANETETKRMAEQDDREAVQTIARAQLGNTIMMRLLQPRQLSESKDAKGSNKGSKLSNSTAADDAEEPVDSEETAKLRRAELARSSWKKSETAKKKNAMEKRIEDYETRKNKAAARDSTRETPSGRPRQHIFCSRTNHNICKFFNPADTARQLIFLAEPADTARQRHARTKHRNFLPVNPLPQQAECVGETTYPS